MANAQIRPELNALEQRVREEIKKCVAVFYEPKNRRGLRDLSTRFWSSLATLDAMTDEPADDLHAALRIAYKHLGAPGDFGYGTPCGEALRNLYDAWATWRRAVVPAPSTSP